MARVTDDWSELEVLLVALMDCERESADWVLLFSRSVLQP